MSFFKLWLMYRIKDPVLISLFCMVCMGSLAQSERRVDSLKNVLKAGVYDTNRVNALHGLSRHYFQRSYADARSYGAEALELARKLNFKKGMALAHNDIGDVCRMIAEYQEALMNYRASLQIWEELGDKKGIALAYNNIGLIHVIRGDYVQALLNLRASLTIRVAMEDQKGIAATQLNIGDLYNRQGSYPEALKNLLAALKILENFREDVRDNKDLALCYSYLGITYERQGDLIKALDYHLTSLQIRKEIRDRPGIAASYANLGLIYDRQGDSAKALKYHFDALEIRKETGEKKEIAVCYMNIGLAYGRQNNNSKALENYFNSLNINKDIGEKRAVAACDNNIGKIYTRICEYDKARQYLTQGLSISKDIQAKDLIREAYNALSRVDSATGNYKQAYTYYKSYTAYKDSILNEKNSQSFSLQQIEFESEKKDREIVQMKERYESEKKDKEILQLANDKQKLESEKQIGALLLKSKQDSLRIMHGEKVKLENDKIKLENDELKNEKELQRLKLENDSTAYALKKAEADKSQQQVNVLNKENAIRTLQLNRQTQAKNYFIGGLVLFVILSFFIYRYYHARQKLKLLTLRSKIASDLHDDVGSTLSSISIFSQMAQQQSSETIPMLETIGDSSRKMLDAMADIVWTIKPENDQFERIIMRMKSFAYELLGAKKIDFEFIAGEDIEKFKLPMEVRRNLYLIFKEATNNMVKYSCARRAMFAIRGEKNNLTMIIKDDGIGFNTGYPTDGNGLKNMKQRAKEIGADFIIDSHPGNGTTIQLNVAV